MKQCYIFDIDGTLANIEHRLHFIQDTPKDWDSFYDNVDRDLPIEHMIELAKIIGRVHPLVFSSGRRESTRHKTGNWLADQGLFGPIYMRKDDDYRADNIIKKEIFYQILADGYEPIMAFDDRTQVVEMWRELGLPCAQVAKGNY